MYSDGVWFFWEIEQCINSILNHYSKKSFFFSFFIFINNNERKPISNCVQESIKSLETFNSSIEKSYEITSIAEPLRNNIHKQVIKAKIELQKLISNYSIWNEFRNYIYSKFGKREENGLICDIQKDLEHLEYLDNDLMRITKILLNFKENLKIHSDVLHKLSDNIESLKRLELDKLEIRNIRELLSMIKENHKKFNK
jgi:hypothetical protein